MNGQKSSISEKQIGMVFAKGGQRKFYVYLDDIKT